MSNLIKIYGELWNPDTVDWGKRGAGNRGKLEGKVKTDGNTYIADFWEARGVYVLYDNFRAIYVGKTEDQFMGVRLRQHLTDRLAGRWDMFSWYSLSSFRKLTKDVAKPGKRYLTPEMINTLEALAILISDPRLNRKREKLPAALLAEQLDTPHPNTVRHYLETVLAKLEEVEANTRPRNENGV